eukprot:COSAG02_NODE_11691_length_1673_cov_1.152478_2_plen_71_part_00
MYIVLEPSKQRRIGVCSVRSGGSDTQQKCSRGQPRSFSPCRTDIPEHIPGGREFSRFGHSVPDSRMHDQF